MTRVNTKDVVAYLDSNKDTWLTAILNNDKHHSICKFKSKVENNKYKITVANPGLNPYLDIEVAYIKAIGFARWSLVDKRTIYYIMFVNIGNGFWVDLRKSTDPILKPDLEEYDYNYD